MTRSASATRAMSAGVGSNVWTSPPGGTRLETSTCEPPTWRTRSARTLVVATTLIASGAGAGPLDPTATSSWPAQPATKIPAIRTTDIQRVISSLSVGRRIRMALASAVRRCGGAEWARQPGSRDRGRRARVGARRPDSLSAGRPRYDSPQALIGDVRDAAAARADHVVVMERLANDIGVFACRQVDALDRAQLGEHLEGAEDGCPSEPQPARPRMVDEIGRREVPLVLGDQRSDGAPRFGEPVAGAFEGGGDRRGVEHCPKATSAGRSCRDCVSIRWRVFRCRRAGCHTRIGRSGPPRRATAIRS